MSQQVAVIFHNALGALRLKRHRLVGTRDGVVIQQPGKPDLLPTHEAAERFGQQIEEEQNP